MTRTYHPDGSPPADDQIFVFGSNLSGFHGGGAAKAAHHHYGAQWGVGVGPTGRCYALPTVKHHISGPLLLDDIESFIWRFLEYARANLNTQKFFVTRVGCGLAGYEDKDIAPMFADAPANCSLPDTWAPFFTDQTTS